MAPKKKQLWPNHLLKFNTLGHNTTRVYSTTAGPQGCMQLQLMVYNDLLSSTDTL